MVKDFSMSFEMTVGLFVVHGEKYASYRAAIAPLLEAAEGRFRYDFEVARTLKTENRHDINRLFVLQFPDRASKERFFTDPDTLKFVPASSKAVRGTAIIAEYFT